LNEDTELRQNIEFGEPLRLFLNTERVAVRSLGYVLAACVLVEDLGTDVDFR